MLHDGTTFQECTRPPIEFQEVTVSQPWIEIFAWNFVYAACNGMFKILAIGNEFKITSIKKMQFHAHIDESNWIVIPRTQLAEGHMGGECYLI